MSRENIMLLAAFASVLGTLALLVLVTDAPEAVQGFAMGIGGMFARNIGTAFDYEFGSSRGSTEKTKMLAELQSNPVASPPTQETN